MHAIAASRGSRRALSTFLVPVLLATTASLAAGTTDTFSLVIDGRLHDVETVHDLSLGRLISAELFTLVAEADKTIAVDTRPDRGHIVITTGVTHPANTPIQAFKTSRTVVVVNGSPVSAEGRLVSGVPFLTVDTIQTILEAMKFDVICSVESKLIAVIHSSAAPAAGQGRESPGIGETEADSNDPLGGPAPGSDLLEVVQRSAYQALQQMGAPGSIPTQPYDASGANARVCGAMDELRSLWEATEPSAIEKATFRALADKFQEAKDNQGALDPADVDNMVETLARFRIKVDRRTEGTRAWTAPAETGQVKTYGVGFLETFTQAMDLARTMMKALQEQDPAFVEQAGDLIANLKSLESKIQEQGMRFDREVVRVRQAYGCGPARTGVPPS